MNQITDYIKPELDALGDNKIEASLSLHRKKLSKTSELALDIMTEELPNAKLKDVVTVYDITRKHLNTIDGRSESQTLNIFMPPPELQARYSLAEEIKAQIIETEQCKKSQNKLISTPPKLKSPKTTTASES